MTKKLLLRELSRYSLGTFADIIYRNALLYPEGEAFVCGSERVSFKQFNQRVNQLIHGLYSLGFQEGDIIGILSWNRLEYPVVFGAAMKGGFVLAHFNPRLKPEELVQVINDSEPRVLFISPDLIDTINEIQEDLLRTKTIFVFADSVGQIGAYTDLAGGQPEEEPDTFVDEDDPLTIFYTSGTTGMPRGAIYNHRQKMENTRMKALDIGVKFGDRHLVVLPMFHIGGDSHIWPFFLKGGCNVIMPLPLDLVDALKALEQERITDIHIVPTQLVALMNLPDIDKYDHQYLERIWYAASPMPTEILKQGLSVFGPIFIQGYGLTESGPDVTILTRENHHHPEDSTEAQSVLGSSGQPCIGVHVRIVDGVGQDIAVGEVGEIVVQSKRTMTGYYQRPEETKEAIRDGWLFTGDLGYYDEKGFIYIVDRKKDMIITGGENVYPVEVENVLYRHPAIKEVAVVGVPDPYWIERVHAVVVLKTGASTSEEDIINFCKENIAGYKAPKSVELVEDLPKNPQGKILKREIRARYRE